MQSDWPRAFLLITPAPNFSKIRSFCRIIKATMGHHTKPTKAHINGLKFLPTPKTRLTNWLKDRLTDRLTNWLTDQPTVQPTNQQTDQPTDQPTDQTTNRPTDTLADQLTDWLIDQQTNQGTNWVTNWPTDQPTNWPTWLTDPCFKVESAKKEALAQHSTISKTNSSLKRWALFESHPYLIVKKRP